MLKSKSEVSGDRNILASAPTWFQNQMYAESVANTQAMNQLRLAIVAKAVEVILNPSPGSDVDPSMMMALIDKLGEGMTPKSSSSGEE